MGAIQNLSTFVDHLHRHQGTNAGEPLLAAVARGLIDDFGNGVLEVGPDGSVVMSRSGIALFDKTGALQVPTGTATSLANVVAALAAEVTRAETAEAALAPLASPNLTGSPTAPTAALGTSNGQLATTAFVSQLVNTLTSGAPGTLNTFLEAYNRFVSDESLESSLTAIVGAKLTAANNLSDLPAPATARTNLGLNGAALLNVGTAAGTVAAGNDSRLTVTTLEQYDTSGIIAAGGDVGPLINTVNGILASGSGGIIQLRENTYNVATKVSLSGGVHLRGANAGPKHRGSTGVQTVAEGLNNGTVIAFTYASGGSATDPAGITVGQGASLSDVSLYEPSQVNNGTPNPYCFAVRIPGYGSYVGNVELINNYRGIDIQGGRNRVENISGNPLALGIQQDNCQDYTEIYGVEFVPSWTTGASTTWVINNGVGLSIGRADDIRVRDVRTFNYFNTLNLFVGVGGYGTYGIIDGLSADSSFSCIVNNGTGSRELIFTNVRLICDGGTTSSCYSSPAGTNSGGVKFFGGYFASASGTAPLVTMASGQLQITGATFANNSAQQAVSITGGLAAIHNNLCYYDLAGVFTFSGSGVHATCWGNRWYSSTGASGGGTVGGPIAGATGVSSADVRLHERASGTLQKANSQTISASPTAVSWDTAYFSEPGVTIPGTGPVAVAAGRYRVTVSLALSAVAGSNYGVYLVSGTNGYLDTYAQGAFPGTGTNTLQIKGSSVVTLAAGAAVTIQINGLTSGSVVGSVNQNSITLEQL